MGSELGASRGRSGNARSVKLLLDEMMATEMAPLLVGHDVAHVVDLGWRHISNGKLLAMAETTGFQAFITKDGNIPYQQNLAGRVIGLLILRPKTQDLRDLLDMVPEILVALAQLNPGDVLRVP